MRIRSVNETVYTNKKTIVIFSLQLLSTHELALRKLKTCQEPEM
jgi:hypothetical protein